MLQAGAGHMRLSSEVKRYRWEEIESMTLNFRKVIGVGGFSFVYLARLRDYNVMAAFKVYIGSERLNKVFRTELDISWIVDHPYIVKLIGYCDEIEEGVLVFEMISNGTLHRRLCGRGLKDITLPWKSRMAIAFQLPHALEYLNESCSLQIVHGDVKSSNILVDSQLNCKL
ncbi:putative receptor-like protein [Drosera capensis]